MARISDDPMKCVKRQGCRLLVDEFVDFQLFRLTSAITVWLPSSKWNPERAHHGGDVGALQDRNEIVHWHIPPNPLLLRVAISHLITRKSQVNCSKMRLHVAMALAALAVTAEPVTGFTASSSKTPSPRTTTPSTTPLHPVVALQSSPKDDDDQHESNRRSSMSSVLAAAALGVILSTAGMFGGGIAFAADGATTTSYDGFAEYAKENQMEKSDVGCFINKCGDQTKQLFSNPRGIKGITCLGRCKGEQSCAVRCFSEFGSEDLNNWLSCTIEENDCVKVPKNIDTTAENVGYTTTVKKFDPSLLVGTWYKTNGLNPNYDLFDCQSNSFKATAADSSELDMDIFLRVNRPDEAGGGFWENALSEHMVVDAVLEPNQAEGSRTMHTEGKMNGLTFDENWYILGQSDGKGNVPAFVLVAYKGHTLQGGYEGSFVYSKEPVLPAAAVPAVKEAATKAGLNWDDYQQIDNTCPSGIALNDADAGTGTSTSDWIDLVVGEGGVIDWISPGWRGEYKKS